MSILWHAEIRSAQDATADSIANTTEQLDYLVLEVSPFCCKEIRDVFYYEVLGLYPLHNLEVITKRKLRGSLILFRLPFCENP